MFLKDKMEALAGLRPGLIGDVEKIPGSRILDGQFTAVQQAIGTPKKNAAGAAWSEAVRGGREEIGRCREADREARRRGPAIGRAAGV